MMMQMVLQTQHILNKELAGELLRQDLAILDLCQHHLLERLVRLLQKGVRLIEETL